MTEQEAENLIPEDHSVMTLYPDCKGLNDRIIITVDIKVPGYNSYSLDAQIDTGAMCSCARFGAIPEYYWKPIQTYFTTVNKTKMPIKGFAPDFPLFLNGLKLLSICITLILDLIYF
jgi:hypothetical protein